MSIANRLDYYKRTFSAYLMPVESHLTFWHETPQANSHATFDRLGPYYMRFDGKAEYSGEHDPRGIPLLNYRGKFGLQYNPIAIAQWGLGNYNAFCENREPSRRQKFLAACDWLCENLETNAFGVPVWNHQFDWEYRDRLKNPWYSGLAQGQGISLLVRGHAETMNVTYLDAAQRAFA
ncbi:MAG: hypothetical protein JOY93_06035, partial [Acidobacteriales bacterium]|nr:hypothetical protein [Terriglobales bacterium]